MSIYDLDRLSKRTAASCPSSAVSLVLHLHPNHLRFQHQNGVFMYDSPILPLLDSIRNARLPVALLDLLDATEVRYVEGCLVVEVHDHRGATGGDGSLTSPASMQDASMSSGIGHNLGKRTADGVLKPVHPSADSSNAGSKTGGTSHSGQNALSLLDKRFMTTYSKFEEARQEAAALRLKHAARLEAQQAAKLAKAAAAASNNAESAGKGDIKSTAQSSNGGSTVTNSNNTTTGPPSSSLQSAVAAAIASASATSMGKDASGDPSLRKSTNATTVPVYRIILASDAESVWLDLCSLRNPSSMLQRSQTANTVVKPLTDEELLAVEARVLALTAPPLCLSPDPDVGRIANLLMDASALPYDTGYAPLQLPVIDDYLVRNGIGVKSKTKKRKKNGKKLSRKEGQAAKIDNSLDADAQAELDIQAAAEAALLEAAAARLDDERWMMVMDESYGRAFQPSFKRIAFLNEWRSRKAEEAKRAQQAAMEQALASQQAQQAASANAATGTANSAGTSNTGRQQANGRPRAESVVSNGDIAVGDISTQQDERESSAQLQPPSISLVIPSSAPAAPVGPPKKRKYTKKAGSPAVDTPVSSTAGPPSATSLKLTLGKKSDNAASPANTAPPKKKKEKKAAAAAAAAAASEKADIAVSIPSTSAASPPPSSAVSQTAATPSASTPSATPGQPTSTRKTAPIPKAKLKSDLKAQAQAAAAAANAAASNTASPAPPATSGSQQQSPSQPAGKTASSIPPSSSPVQNNHQIPQVQINSAQMSGVQVPMNGNVPQQMAHFPPGMTPQQMQQAAQRAFSPMQAGQPGQAGHNPYPHQNASQLAPQHATQMQLSQAQHAYMNQLQAQANAMAHQQSGKHIQRPGSVQMATNIGPAPSSYGQQQQMPQQQASYQQQQQMAQQQQLQQQQQQQQNPYLAVNRSPMYTNAALSTVQQGQAVQGALQGIQIPGGMTAGMPHQQQFANPYQGLNVPGGPSVTGFSPQQAMQLLQIQQQQQQQMQQNPQAAAAAALQQQALHNYTNGYQQQNAQGAPPQFNQNMLNQLRAQQQQQQIQMGMQQPQYSAQVQPWPPQNR